MNSIGDFFSDEIVDGLVNRVKESQMYSEILKLIRDSELQQDQITELLQLYEENERAEFLGRVFLYAVVGDSLRKDVTRVIEIVDADIRAFKELIKKSHKKAQRIEPPEEIEDHELVYVRELYKVYPQLTGEDYVRPDDLDAQPKLRRDFNCQRKDYYSAETIHRELRDAIQLDENEGFCNYNL